MGGTLQLGRITGVNMKHCWLPPAGFEHAEKNPFEIINKRKFTG